MMYLRAFSLFAGVIAASYIGYASNDPAIWMSATALSAAGVLYGASYES